MGTCEEPFAMSCQSTTGGSTTGGTGGSTTGGTTTGGTGGSYIFPASGTFISADDAGAMVANATLTSFQALLGSYLEGDAGYQFSITAGSGDGMSSATFSLPSGIGGYTFASNIVFPNAPAVGSISSSASCGNVGFHFGPSADPFLYGYTAQVAGAACSGQIQGGGSWTLTFTSVSAPGGSLGDLYTAHGNLQASMPDGMGDVGQLSLTF
jgi:hypothetical protein